MMDMSSRFLNNGNNTILPIEVKQEPLDFSTPPLDLRISRKRPPSPSPYDHYQQSKTIPVFIEPPPTMPMSSSPNSNTGSDTSETGSENTIHSYSNYPSSPQLISRVKATRPFKAYPKDPMSMAIGSTTTDTGTDSTDAYSEFRQRMLSQVQSSHNGTNKNMRRISQSMQNPQSNDPNYWEKRKKNNEAAKRSRDARRAKEDEIAIRCAFLEQENMQLKFRIAGLEAERERLQNIMYH